tara:strand:+ start:876 stop:1169 length:294 start_codon:yes stop_codon:yes gene_type:complete
MKNTIKKELTAHIKECYTDNDIDTCNDFEYVEGDYHAELWLKFHSLSPFCALKYIIKDNKLSKVDITKPSSVVNTLVDIYKNQLINKKPTTKKQKSK